MHYKQPICLTQNIFDTVYTVLEISTMLLPVFKARANSRRQSTAATTTAARPELGVQQLQGILTKGGEGGDSRISLLREGKVVTAGYPY
jgi:hypothetical protein